MTTTTVQPYVDGPSWFYGPEQLGTLAISVTSSGVRPIFVRLAPRDDVLRWPSSTAYDEVDAFGGIGHAVNATRQRAALDAGATFPHPKGVGIAVLVSGVLLLGVGALAIALPVPAGSPEPGGRPERRP